MDKINLQRNVYEGWTPQNFIDELEPTIKMIMKNNSYIKPFENKKQLKEWCIDNQPYYKKHIPEVFNYFSKKYNIN